ncbi:MAG: hypothetical protein SFX72_19930 [Isosphaeraceae bacterium]|nr:hypothetical protein [Isosphaeraceae bacterium]
MPGLQRALIIASLLAITAGTASSADSLPEAYRAALREGDLSTAEMIASGRLSADPKDDDARFGLAAVQFLAAVRDRARSLYRHGLSTQFGGLISTLPLPQNPRPEPLDAAGLRKLLLAWLDDLDRCEATLASIQSETVRLELPLGALRLDLDGDGEAGPSERLWAIYRRFNRAASDGAETESIQVVFDRGDVDWLRGYCRLLSAPAEMLLAHDFSMLYDRCGGLLFGGAVPRSPLSGSGPIARSQFGAEQIADLVAAVHLVRLPMIAPERMKAARQDLLAVIASSRTSWNRILAETDDDLEWLPNPRQKAAATSSRITQEMVDAWMKFLDEAEAILEGKKLVPHWRIDQPRRGIDLAQVFEAPREFDLVLWVQGTSALPYVREGDTTDPQVWSRLERVFRGELLGFAFWIN